MIVITMKIINRVTELATILNTEYTGLVFLSAYNKRIIIYKFPKKSRCAEYHRMYNADRKKRGICIVCGNKAIKDKSKCQRCFDRISMRRKLKIEIMNKLKKGRIK